MRRIVSASFIASALSFALVAQALAGPTTAPVIKGVLSANQTDPTDSSCAVKFSAKGLEPLTRYYVGVTDGGWADYLGFDPDTLTSSSRGTLSGSYFVSKDRYAGEVVISIGSWNGYDQVIDAVATAITTNRCTP